MKISGNEPDAVTHAVEEAFASLPDNHPRLFIPASQQKEWRERLASSPLLTAVGQKIISNADAAVGLPPVQCEVVGRRMPTSRLALKRILTLSLAYRLTEKQVYADQAVKEMLSAASFPDWNPSHFLDTAEMTAALAIGLDWCHEGIRPEDRAVVAEAILRLGLKAGFDPHPDGNRHKWISADNNWNQVCHGGLTLGALVVHDLDPDLARKTVERAVRNLPHVLNTYAPDGAYVEGATYWSYGTTYNVLFLDAVQSALGTDFGLTDSQGFLQSAEYILHVQGPSGLYFNYADCAENPDMKPALYWMARRMESASMLWQELPLLETFLEGEDDMNKRTKHCEPLVLLWAEDLSDLEPPEDLHWSAGGKMPVAFHRSSWKPDATYVAIKGGSPSLNHAQMDVGSFVLEMDGVRWAVDLGQVNYHLVEKHGLKLWGRSQDSDRWTLFRNNSFSHNLFLVNGEQQRVKGWAGVVESTADPQRSVVDLSEIYAGSLAHAQRTLQLKSADKVLLGDTLTTLDQEVQVRWAMATRAEIRSIDSHSVLLRQNGKALRVDVSGPPEVEWEFVDAAKLRNPWEKENPGLRMLTFTYTIPEQTRSRCEVTFTVPE